MTTPDPNHKARKIPPKVASKVLPDDPLKGQGPALVQPSHMQFAEGMLNIRRQYDAKAIGYGSFAEMTVALMDRCGLGLKGGIG